MGEIEGLERVFIVVWNKESVSKLYKRERILDEPKKCDDADNYVEEIWERIISNDEMKGA